MKKGLEKIKIENAVGTILAHDITRIIPGKFKGVGFKKGHIVEKDDIPRLLEIGKQHIYVLNLSESDGKPSSDSLSPLPIQRAF